MAATKIRVCKLTNGMIATQHLSTDADYDTTPPPAEWVIAASALVDVAALNDVKSCCQLDVVGGAVMIDLTKKADWEIAAEKQAAAKTTLAALAADTAVTPEVKTYLNAIMDQLGVPH